MCKICRYEKQKHVAKSKQPHIGHLSVNGVYWTEELEPMECSLFSMCQILMSAQRLTFPKPPQGAKRNKFLMSN